MGDYKIVRNKKAIKEYMRKIKDTISRIGILLDKPSEMLCPNCDGKSFHVVRVYDGRYHLHRCPKCGRVWCEEYDE